jgi:dTDP-4-amino-4,6-dideoxygalactose transaminase
MFRITVGTVDIGQEAKKKVMEALNSNRISSGKYVEEFEGKFAGYHGVSNAIAVDTGTSACTIALAVLHDIAARRDEEVIVPALTFIATANAVLHAGFRPVFVDAGKETYNINPEKIEEAITPKTRAIMPVHLFGRPCGMDKILDIARRNNLYVIEDASEAHGAVYNGRKVGTFGALAAFSFYVAHIVTTGEGGAIITRDEEIAKTCRSLRAHGRACKCKKCVLNISSSRCPLRFKLDENTDTRFFFEHVGYSCKMNEMEAAIGLEQVDKLDEIINKRRRNLHFLNSRLKEFEEYFQLFRDNKGEAISPLAYPVLIRPGVKFRRKDIVNFLEENGIETRPMFSSIPTQQPAYKYLGLKTGRFPEAEYIGKQGFYIGIHQGLKEEDLHFAAETIKKFIRKKG